MKKLLIVIFVLAELISNATNYYVSNTGSDSNDGLTTGAAWQTISKVNSTSFSPGDQILFNRGDTWAETLIIPSSGSSGNPIFFGAYGSGADPIITGSDLRTPVVNVGDRSYITINNITIEHAAANFFHGALRTGTNSIVGLVIQNCTIQNNRGSGISLSDATTATSVTIDNCVIQDNGKFGILVSAAFTSGEIKDCQISGNGIYADTDAQQYSNIQGNLGNLNIHGNTITDATPSSNNYGGSCHGIYHSTPTTNVVNIYNNTIYGNSTGGAIKARYSANIYNNLIYGNGYYQLNLGYNETTDAVYNIHNNIIYGSSLGYPGLILSVMGSGTVDLNIYNNIFYKNSSVYSDTKEISIISNATSLKIKNNIIYAPDSRGGIKMVTQSNADIDYNLYWKDTESGVPNNIYNGTTYTTLAEWQALGFDTNGVNDNPDLVNPTTDFQLQETSPAIDAGVDVGLTTDYAGNPVSSPPSIGAYEYGASAPVQQYKLLYNSETGKIIGVVPVN